MRAEAISLPGADESHANNFNLLRLIAAGLVIVSHAYGLRHPAGFYARDSILSSQGVGWAAVNVFFVISGFLIAQAVQRDPDPLRFVRNRMLRIYPGLIVCSVSSVLALGVVFRPGDLNRYLSAPETIRFLLGAASAVLPQYTLPGFFAGNPSAGVVNGSLWSLPLEIACYAVVATLLASGGLARPKIRAFVFAAVVSAYLVGVILQTSGDFPRSSTLHDLHRLAICFALGMAFAYVRPTFKVRLWQVMAVIFLFSLSCRLQIPAAQAVTATLTLVLASFWLAFLQHPVLSRFRSAPDWSYGVYIYAFPIQQMLMAFWPSLHPLLHAVAAFALVLIPAALSWRFIERPALALKRAGWFQRRPRRRPASRTAAASADGAR